MACQDDRQDGYRPGGFARGRLRRGGARRLQQPTAGGRQPLRAEHEADATCSERGQRLRDGQGPVARCAETEEGFDGAERRMRLLCGV